MAKDSSSPSSAKFKKFLKSLGPGIVTGAADDDPSGIGTYTMAGARYGTSFLWAAVLSWPLMAVVQMSCARIGMMTGQGLAVALEKKVPRPVLILFGFCLFIANTLNVGADLSAMGDSVQLLAGGENWIYVLILALIIFSATVWLNYCHIARVLKWLAVFLFAYVITAFLVGPDWKQALHDTFLPHWPRSSGEWSMLVAILGTTISPYLFFWQASQEVEEEKEAGYKTLAQRVGLSQPDLRGRAYDVGLGTFFSVVVMYFIMLSTALTLHRHGLTHIESSKQAAEALRPIAGAAASWLYALGLVGTGMLAIPTLTCSVAYAMADTFRWNQGLNAPLKKARAFYGIVLLSTAVAVLFDFAGVNPIKALYWSAVVNGLLAPFVLLAICFVVRDAKIMRGRPAPALERWILGACTALMLLATAGMVVL